MAPPLFRARARATQAAAGAPRPGRPLPDALLFDCDGVLVDTERDGHRVSFNEAFKRKGALLLGCGGDGRVAA